MNACTQCEGPLDFQTISKNGEIYKCRNCHNRYEIDGDPTPEDQADVTSGIKVTEHVLPR